VSNSAATLASHYSVGSKQAGRSLYHEEVGVETSGLSDHRPIDFRLVKKKPEVEPAMKPKVYIETSVISYLVADMSENVRISGHQLATHDFWELLPDFNVFISDTVVEEASKGDEGKAQDRLWGIRDFPVLEIDEKTQALAIQLVSGEAIPARCPEDALHIAVAAINEVEFIVTWNFKHINNPFMMRKISDIVTNAGYRMPVICSPEEFMEAEHD
jgi:hypothetical protein